MALAVRSADRGWFTSCGWAARGKAGAQRAGLPCVVVFECGAAALIAIAVGFDDEARPGQRKSAT